MRLVDCIVAAVLTLAGWAAPQEDTQDMPWLEPFLRTVPAETAAVVVVAVSPRDFFEEIRNLLQPAEVNSLHEWLDESGQQQALDDLLEKVDEALFPRIGFVIQKNVPDPGIPVAIPSPMPQVTGVFWIRDGMVGSLRDFQEFVKRHYRNLGFENAFQLRVDPEVPVRLLEFTNRNIPATGHMSMALLEDRFMIGNSGPLLRGILKTGFSKNPSLAERLGNLSPADPDSGSAVALIHRRNLRLILEDHEATELTDEWMMSLRGLVERGLISFDSAGVPEEEARRDFNQHLAGYLTDAWDQQRDVRMTLSRDGVLEMLRLLMGR